MTSSSLLRGITTLSLCLVLGLARAQDDEPYEVDPPDRAARLSFIQGEVVVQPAGEQDWAEALLNRPLTSGDQLRTEQDSRAEIQVGPAAVRLAGNTDFTFLNIDADSIQMHMTAGVVSVTVRASTEEQIEIDTPNIALSLLGPGSYRIQVNDAGATTVVRVSEGEAEASGPRNKSVVVRAQQVATFTGFENLDAQFSTPDAPDEFDTWSLERDRRDYLAMASRTAEYVSPEVTGYQDLEEHGTWSSEPEYGNVWTPSHVGADWSPYRYGRWASVAPWGWTWIDDASWGYAPFHYGRWAHVRNRWCWVPGPRHVRPVYAPAVVGWVGTPRVSYSGSFAGVAWFPLGPREVYVPGRRFSPHYVERVNLSNTTIISRAVVREVYENRARNVNYRNRTMPGAVTAVSRAAFTSSQRVGNHRSRSIEQEIQRVAVSAMPPQTNVNRLRTDRVPRAEGPAAIDAPRTQPTLPHIQDLRTRPQPDRAQAPVQQQRGDQDVARSAATRQVEQRARNVDQPRVQPRQQESQPSRPAVQEPAESRAPAPRNNQPRAKRN